MKLYNIVKVYTSTTGTGTVTLGSAVPSFITFATAGVVSGSTVSYAIEDGSNREVGTGTYTSGVETLTRTVVTSTNANSLISLSGNAIVFITGLAADLSSDTANTANTLVMRNGSGNFSAGAATLSSAVMSGSSSGTTTIQAQATASGTLTLPAATDTLVGKATTDTLTNKTLDTAGVGNVFRINGTQVSAVTGSGSVVLATSPTLVTPLLGTPTSGTLTNCTGLPISSGVSGLGANVATFLATPTAANLAAAVTDETGSGSLVFGTSPTIVTPTITTSATVPLVIGGTGTTSTLTLRSTSGVGTTGADIILQTGSNGATEVMRLQNGGNVGIGTSSPGTKLEVFGSITARAATTQDAVVLAGRAGGTGSFGVTLTPTTLTASRTVTLADGNTTLQAGTMATTGGTLAQFAATTSAQLLGVISDETGSGSLVFANTPTLVTPNIGAATGTSLAATGGSVTVRAAATQDAVILTGRAGGTSSFGVTLTPTTLTASRTVTLADGNTTLQAGTMAITGGTLAQFAATTSAQLAGVISDETGSGSLVFANTPTLVTPNIGAATGTSLAATGGSVTVRAAATQDAVILTGRAGGVGSFGVTLTPTTLTASRTVTLADGDTTLQAGTMATTGGTLAQFAATTSAQLAGVISDETGSGSLVFGTSPTIATPTITTSAVIPLVNGGTAASSTLTLQSTSGAGTSDAIIFRTASQSEKMRITSAGNVGIGATPTHLLDIQKTTGDAVFRSLAGTVDFRSYASQGFSVGFTGMFSNHDLLIVQNSLERMRFTSNGTNFGSVNPTDANFSIYSTGTTYVPFTVLHTASTTNDAPVAMQLRRSSSGTPAAGMGCTLQFVLQDAGAAQIGTHQIVSAWSNPAVLNRETSLRINYSKANSNFEALRIDTDGNVLIGYTASNGAYKLQVNSQIFATNATIATSDRRYKKDITPIKSGLDVVSKLNPVSFTWKEHDIHQFDSGTQVGFIAQDVQAALTDEPYLESVVKRNEVELKDGTKEEFYGLSDSKLIPILVKAIQELKAKINTLEARN